MYIRVENKEWTVHMNNDQVKTFGHLQKYMASLYNFIDLV